MTVDGSDVAVLRTTIETNKGTKTMQCSSFHCIGGGMTICNSEILLVQSLVSGNIAELPFTDFYGLPAVSAGGISAEGGEISIIESAIADSDIFGGTNGAGSSIRAGGMAVVSSAVQLLNVSVKSNRILEYSNEPMAGGVFLDASDVKIIKSNISGNKVENWNRFETGGLLIYGGETVISDTEIGDNFAFGGTNHGAGGILAGG